MATYEIIGWVGTSLTSIYLIPQSIKTIIKRNTKGISLLMYLLLITASLVWICYAVISPEINYQIAVTNILQAFFASIIFIIKLINVIQKKDPNEFRILLEKCHFKKQKKD
ncbi:SemiSWEET family sugar transporter [Spiroplasma sp. Moj]|uniref:SemiSWEET family sugar transporter n=1 Tax=Spiroplasma sp. Moj TaxID=1922342 RepID=UPI0039EF3A48|nr:hypothetical protein [Spiroplasma sp. Moj]